MSKEAKYTTEKGKIFYETFNDEQTVRKNGYQLTNVTDNFREGTVEGDGSLTMERPFHYTGSITIKCRVYMPSSILVSGTKYFIDGRAGGSSFVGWSGSVFAGNLTTQKIYNNGVLSSIPIADAWNNIVYTGSASDIGDIIHGFSGNKVIIDGLKFDLFEIYNYEWSAEEVANAYNNKRYFEPSLSNIILDVSALSGTIRNKLSGDTYGDGILHPIDLTDGWTTLGDATIINSNNFDSGTNDGIQKTGLFTIGKKYRLHIKGNSLGTLRIYNTGGGTLYKEFSIGDIDDVFDFTATTTDGLYLRCLGSYVNTNLEYFSVKEVIPETVNTDVEVKKDGNIYVPEFNGLTSKINTGSYFDYVGDITIMTWVKALSFGEGNAGHILSADISKVNLFVTSFDSSVGFSRDGGGHTTYSGLYGTKFNEYRHIAVISKADGTTSIYINGVQSGIANRPAGTSSVSVDTYVGNRSSEDRCFDGNISNIKVIKGLLTAEEISQIYTSEKHKYCK